jgi:hypothetical protein
VPLMEALRECGEVEPARSATNDSDPHGSPHAVYAGFVTTVTQTLFR